jgi:parvulin-like peptidyl-prolyl isomerase
MVERVREREVQGRIRISDVDVDRFVDQQRGAAASEVELNLAQILVTVPEGAHEAQVAERRARIDQAVAKLRGGADFASVAREFSEDGNRAKGGEIGLRPTSRLPDLFVESTRALKVGDISEAPLRSGAGFHLLKVLERRDAAAFRVTQTRARHILLRTSAQASVQDATRRLEEHKRTIETGQRRFEDVAREVSEDGSASAGGDLGRCPAEVATGGVALRRAPDPGGGAARHAAERQGGSRAGARRAARAEVRVGIPGVGQGPARARLHRNARATAVMQPLHAIRFGLAVHRPR